jgi:hypothetical protein
MGIHTQAAGINGISCNRHRSAASTIGRGLGILTPWPRRYERNHGIPCVVDTMGLACRNVLIIIWDVDRTHGSMGPGERVRTTCR